MTRDSETILGFDLRADPSLIWADRGLRPREFLLGDVPQPLAADSSVWRHLPGDSLRGASSFTVQGWRYASIDEAKAASVATQVVIAVTARSVSLDKEQREHRRRASIVGGAPSAGWSLLGYDVGDGGCLSGLSNCGYGDDRDAWVATWGAKLNEHHLVVDPVHADALVQATNARVQEHAPFAALGLYLA